MLQAAALLALGSAGQAQALDHLWFGGNGDWFNAALWAPADPPGIGDRAILMAGTATLAAPAQVAGLQLAGGAIAGAGDLQVSGASSWSAGSLAGLASTSFHGDLAISGAGLKVIVGSRSVHLHGTTTWAGNTAANNNAIRFWNGATLTNHGSFVDANPFDSFIEHNVGGPHHFNNTGSYLKLANTTTTVDGGVAFNNSGSVSLQAGVLRPSGGVSSGSFVIAAGARLDLRNGNNTLDNASTSGAGVFEVSSDNVGADALVAVNGGTHSTRFVLSGSTLAGTDHAFQGPFTWSGGSISGAASTSLLADVAITGAATKTLVGGRILNLHGTTTWGGNTGANNNAIRLWNGATLNNHGTFNDVNAFASFVEHSTGGPHHFNNLGAYNKLANTVTTVDVGVAFNNSGNVNLQAGTLLLGGGSSTGSFDIAAGAKLEFRDGASTLDNATTRGAGSLVLSSDNVGGDAVLTVHGGSHSSALLISGSILTGTDHRFQGPVTWTGGAITGAAATHFDGDVMITGAATKTLSAGRVLSLHGTTTWSGNTGTNNNAIDFVNGATINNHGSFNDANAFDAFIAHNRGGPHSFNNLGTYNKLTSTTTLVDNFVSFHNTGTVNLDAGTLQVSSALTNQGLVNIASGATFLGSHSVFVNAGTLTGTGTVATLAGGDIANRGQIEPGFGIGQLHVEGDLTQEAAGVLAFELGSLASFDTLSVSDDVRLAGTIVARNAGYVPVVGDSFVVLSFDQRLSSTTFASVATQGYGPGVRFEAIYNLHDVTLRVVAVPEPHAWGLMLAGLAWLAAWRRRQICARCRA